ncbi:hypothetical protein [Halomonas sp. PR-M31]|nr:hypothetical protein [Halomonas sp. PR-M31]
MKGNVCIVTGNASGIGHDFAKLLAAFLTNAMTGQSMVISHAGYMN